MEYKGEDGRIYTDDYTNDCVIDYEKKITVKSKFWAGGFYETGGFVAPGSPRVEITARFLGDPKLEACPFETDLEECIGKLRDAFNLYVSTCRETSGDEGDQNRQQNRRKKLFGHF